MPSCGVTTSTSTRSCSANVPRAAEADAARGTRDPARAGIRRADDRRGCPYPARPRPQKARGDVRRVRAWPRHRSPTCLAPKWISSRPQRRDQQAEARRDRASQGGRQGLDDPDGGAVPPRAPAAVLVRPHVGPGPDGRAQFPARPDPQRQEAARALRAAGGLRAERVRGDAAGADLVLARGRALGSRARRDAALRRLGSPGDDGGRGVARRRDPVVPRRGGRARAGPEEASGGDGQSSS